MGQVSLFVVIFYYYALSMHDMASGSMGKYVVQEIWANAHETSKAYSSSCSQTVSLSPAISLQFILGMCAAAIDRKNSIKTLFLEVQGLSE